MKPSGAPSSSSGNMAGRRSTQSMPTEPPFTLRKPLIDFLASSILKSVPSESNAPQPGSLCAWGFASAVDLLLVTGIPETTAADDWTFTYPQLRKRHPTFFNAIVTFALSIRSEEQLRTLEQRFPRCQCNLADLRFKRLHFPGGEPLFFLILAKAIFTLLSRFAEVSSETLYRSMKGDPKGRRSRENALEEVGRYILQDTYTPNTLRAALCWYKVTKEEWALRFLGNCFVRHPEGFLDTARSPDGQDFLYAIVSELHKMILELQRTDRPTNIIGVSLDFMATIQLFVRLIKTFMADLLPPRIQLEFEHSCTPLIWDIVKIFFVEMLGTCHPAKKQFFADIELSQQLAHVAFLSARYRRVNLPHADKVLCHLGLDGSEDVMRPRHPYLQIWSIMMILVNKVKKCLNPGCGISPQGHRFPKCARCGVPSYCSRKCQIEAWSSPLGPHKFICKDWSIMMKHPSTADARRLLNAHSDELQTASTFEKLKALAPPPGISEARIAEIRIHLLRNSFYCITPEDSCPTENSEQHLYHLGDCASEMEDSEDDYSSDPETSRMTLAEGGDLSEEQEAP